RHQPRAAERGGRGYRFSFVGPRPAPAAGVAASRAAGGRPEMSVQTTTPPVATAAAPKRRPRWKTALYVIGAFAFILMATLVGWYFVAGWMADRELERVYAELDAEDPNWRWRDLVDE